MMRILLYNYVQPEEPGAGGVGVYLNNLSPALAEHGHDVILMSSGDRDSMIRRQPRLQFSRDRFERAIVYNSPVIAPAVYGFGEPQVYVDSPDLDFIPAALAKRYGHVDVFHFHNVEGLTRSFFYRLREQFPASRILFSAHNYQPMCMRVTLWQQDRVACEDYRDGAACTVCHRTIFDPDLIRKRRRLLPLTSAVKKVFPQFSRLATPIWRALKRNPNATAMPQPTAVEPDPGFATSPASAADYVRFRKSNIDLFRDVFDHVLAVSARTRDVLIGRGVPGDRMAVSYIGTAHKHRFLTSEKLTDIGDGLHVGYIGYMTRDKGFPFLLECLERMPAELAAQMTVTIAARNTDSEAYRKMQELAPRFKQLRYFDGYTHSTLDSVLEGVNIGLIPVLWEDNLPQTAIELVSRGIPILTSDRGGAQEIAHNPTFIFQAGNHWAMIDRLMQISRRTVSLGAFWTGNIRIYSMEEHVEELMGHYRQDRPSPGADDRAARRQAGDTASDDRPRGSIGPRPA